MTQSSHTVWELQKRQRTQLRCWGGTDLLPQALLLVSRPLVVGFVQPLVDLLLLLGPAAEEDVVDEGVLQQCQEHEDEAAHEVDVDGFHVGDLWEGLPQVRVDGCHGEHRRNTCGRPDSGQWTALEERTAMLAPPNSRHGATGLVPNTRKLVH